jgi:hypothetical protein
MALANPTSVPIRLNLTPSARSTTSLHFASGTTECVVQDPCTIKDHCDAGRCVPGVMVCGGLVSEPLTAKNQPRRRIDLRCQVDRRLLAGATRGGSCQAVAFLRAAAPSVAGTAPVYACTAVREGEVDCVNAHRDQLRITKQERKELARQSSAVVRLNLNPLARKALRQQGVLGADVRGTIRLLNGREIGLKCSLALRR